jgi:hypothetical protein
MPKKLNPELVLPSTTPRLVPAKRPNHSHPTITSHLLNTTLSSTFETPHLGLLVENGFINSEPCRILFDDGAEISHLTTHLARQLQVETREANQHAAFADGASTPLRLTAVPVDLRIDDYTEPLYQAVYPLSSYDIIMGEKWLAAYDPVIFHKTNEITFNFRNQETNIREDLERHKSLVSASTFSQAIRRGYEPFPSC